MQKKITYILSNIDKAVAFEWIAESLNKEKFHLLFILLHEKEPYLFQWLKSKNIECYFIPHFGKKSYLKNFFKLIYLLKKIKPDIIHCHLFDANLLGLSTAKLLGIKKRIYTRHHSSYHHEYFPKSVKWDKFCNYLATDIVAISENVKKVLIEKENVCPKKITLIHHGFDLIKFEKVSRNEVDELRNKYRITPNNSTVIGVISRYVCLKGIQFIIPAFKKIVEKYPNAKLLLANTTGPYKQEIQALLNKELEAHQYLEINFEPNIFALYQLFDVYVHTPINHHIEAFGQTYVEALAAGIPSVFTLSGVASEFVENNKNALVVSYKNSNQIAEAIEKILTQPELRTRLIHEGKNSVKKFNLETFIRKLKKIYE